MASRVPQPSLGTGSGGDRLDSAPSHEGTESSSNPVYLPPESDSDDDSYSFIAACADDVELQQRDGGKIHVRELEEDEEEAGDDTPFTRRRGSASTTQSFMLYTPDEERAVIRKFDRRLVSFVSLLYMLSFLDRSSKPTPI